MISLCYFRTRHLLCERNKCEEFTVLHLGFMEYAHYILTVRFNGLEAFHQRYCIKNLKFYVRHNLSRFGTFLRNSFFQFKTYNPAFTQIEIWFRFIYLLFTFGVTVSDMRSYGINGRTLIDLF